MERKFETEEIEEKERFLNKELGICGIVYYNEIKKHGHEFCKRELTTKLFFVTKCFIILSFLCSGGFTYNLLISEVGVKPVRVTE